MTRIHFSLSLVFIDYIKQDVNSIESINQSYNTSLLNFYSCRDTKGRTLVVYKKKKKRLHDAIVSIVNYYTSISISIKLFPRQSSKIHRCYPNHDIRETRFIYQNEISRTEALQSSKSTSLVNQSTTRESQLRNIPASLPYQIHNVPRYSTIQ